VNIASLVLGNRLLCGLRVAGPIVVDARHVSPSRSAALNAAGAADGAVVTGGLGYQFGNARAWLLHDLKRFEQAVLAGILLAGTGWTIYCWSSGREE
jgi:membrane protein DedA with SNARE-associated domain